PVAGGANIFAWQSWLPPVSHTRSQPMNFTVLAPTSPPRRRSIDLVSLPLVNAANDQSGSDDAAMISTFTPSHAGALSGSVMSGPVSLAAVSSVRSRGLALSGPVCESNGLRAKIGSALVAWNGAAVGPGSEA